MAGSEPEVIHKQNNPAIDHHALRGPQRAALGATMLMVAVLCMAWWSAPHTGGEAIHARHRINPNVADAAELMQLPGVGPKTAAAIIEYRQSCGRTPAFASPTDLDSIPRIGPRTIEKLRPFLVFDEASNSGAAFAAAER